MIARNDPQPETKTEATKPKPSPIPLDPPSKTKPYDVLGREGVDAIIGYEIGTEGYYNRSLISVIRPKTDASGCTFGVGYDVGHVTEPELVRDWAGYVSEQDLDAMKKCVGKKGSEADAVKGLASCVRIPYSVAVRQFVERTLPKWIDRSRALWPNFNSLSQSQRASLTSIAFNRGTSLEGRRRDEMRAIVATLANNNLTPIPRLIRSMSRWHTLEGLRKRRHHEAAMFETDRSGLADSAAGAPTSISPALPS